MSAEPPSVADRPLRVLAWPRDANRALNPYNALLYEAVGRRGVEVSEFRGWVDAVRGRPDVLHVHWPEAAVSRPGWLSSLRHGLVYLAACAALRRRGAAIVWTVHNLHSHDRRHPRLETIFLRRFRAMVARFLCLSETSRSAVIGSHAAARDADVAVTRHGHYRGVYPASADRADARATLGWTAGAFGIVHFGRIRPYKNVPALIAAFRTVPDPDARLLIAGSCDLPDLRAEIERLAAPDPRIRLSIQEVAAAEVRALFELADVAVFPFADVHNSGSALLALSLGCPVATPAIGSLAELARDAGPSQVLAWEGPLTAGVLAEARRRFHGRRVPPDALPLHDWDVIAARTVEVYRLAAASAQGRTRFPEA